MYREVLPLLLASAFFCSAQNPISKEYQVKAAFLFNFTQFVEWPQNALLNDDTPLVVGVLGENPFGSYLEEIINNETVESHPLTIQYYSEVSAIENCHILFVGADKMEEMELMSDSFKSKNVLTVGDTDDFIYRGGVIRLFIEKGKIQLQINIKAAKASELKISSKLLRLAQIEKS